MHPVRYAKWAENEKIDYENYMERSEPSALRIFHTDYAEVYKFREWIKKEIEKRKGEGVPTYLDEMIAKFG